MWDYVKLILLGLVALVAAIAADWGHDLAYKLHAALIMLIAGGMFIWQLRQIGETRAVVDDTGYMDGVIRAGVIATGFWGVVGFLAGVFIAFQLAFPGLNFDWGQPFTNFGRLRPLHTSAVIFAFGGNALIMPRPSTLFNARVAARLWGGNTRLVRVLGLSAVHRSGGDRLCWAARSPRNMPSLNGMWTCG